MTYILFLVFWADTPMKGFSVAEFKTKVACEVALKEANTHSFSIVKDESKCMEVNTK